VSTSSGIIASWVSATARVAAPRRIIGGPVAANAFIGCERSFRKLTAAFKVGPPKMPDPMVFPEIEIG
jgi:hypothetical protein